MNVYVQSSNGNKLNLLKSTGPLNLTTGVNDQFTLSNGSGLDAQFSLKTTSENTLGYIEIEQAGTGFSENDNYLVAFPPPKGPSLDLDQNNEGAVNSALVEDGNALDPAGQPLALEDGISPEVNGNLNENNFSSDNPERNKGDVFYFPKNDGTVSLWQALENTIAGVDPNGSASFMEISDLPSGKFEESKKFMSDVESFEKGEQIFYKGKLYQATEKVSPVSSEDGEQISRSYLSGEIFELNGSFFQATSKISKGTDIDLNKLSLNPVGTVTVLNDTDLNDQSTVLSLGNVLPSNQNAVQFPLDQLLGIFNKVNMSKKTVHFTLLMRIYLRNNLGHRLLYLIPRSLRKSMYLVNRFCLLGIHCSKHRILMDLRGGFFNKMINTINYFHPQLILQTILI